MAKTLVPNTSSNTPTHDEIAARAYEIYLREGCVPGRDMDNWLKAETELRATITQNNSNANGQPGAATLSSSEARIATASATPAPMPTSAADRSTPRSQAALAEASAPPAARSNGARRATAAKR